MVSARVLLSSMVVVMLAALVHAPVPTRADEPWQVTQDISLPSRWPVGRTGFREDRVTADLYRPKGEGKVPAAVIINSSGGVIAHTEHYYARVLAKAGMATLVVDSFGPRGVRRTGDDQNRVQQYTSNADAFAGHRWLAAQPWVDTTRIIVLGMSRGGEAAYSAALEGLRKRMQVGDAKFAAHVAIAPGSCNFPQRDVRTTGGPIFFMLGELDPIQTVGACVAYAERMRAAGKAQIRIAVYPGVFHAYEGTSGVHFAADDWASTACAGRFDRDENFLLYHRGTNRRITAGGSQTEYLFKTCLKRGYTNGGDERVKAQATADLLQFLRDVDVLRDETARTLVGDCGGIADAPLRLNCMRARAGWTADLVAMARAYRAGRGVTKDVERAVRLFSLAVERGNSHAMWELSIHVRNGWSVARDPARALALGRSAAEAGDAAGMNVLGVMHRDGIATPKSDTEARLWFERSAQLLNSYAMVNLGRLLKEGRGGLARNPEAAVALYRKAVLRGDNPWAKVALAEALEKGEGVAKNEAEARALYQAAVNQDAEPEAMNRAEEALARLGAPAQPRR